MTDELKGFLAEALTGEKDLVRAAAYDLFYSDQEAAYKKYPQYHQWFDALKADPVLPKDSHFHS
jgi:hypothetical protein